MRYELLGPLRVSHEGRGSSLSAPKMEMTLATLLVGAGCVTTKDQIIEELWGSGPPPGHPERLCPEIPLSPAELAWGRQLLGTPEP